MSLRVCSPGKTRFCCWLFLLLLGVNGFMCLAVSLDLFHSSLVGKIEMADKILSEEFDQFRQKKIRFFKNT